MFQTVDQLFSYFETFTNFEKNRISALRHERLDRMRLLLAHAGMPHEGKKIIHIAGSKGKGSTAAFIGSGLSALGYKTGNYLSPHISNYRERITCNGSFFPEESYLRAGKTIMDLLDSIDDPEFQSPFGPTAFELLTLLALLVFRQEGCDRFVLETGLGGRLDATNVVTPIASVITPIEMEHADVLGDTIEKIAGEKAGIIKPGIPVFSSKQEDAALEVLRKRADDQGSRFYYLPEIYPVVRSRCSLYGSEVEIEGGEEKKQFSIAMTGDFQAENAALAYLVLRTVETDSEALFSGFASATLPGRIETISSDPLIIVDAAHTESSVRRVIANFRSMFDDGVIIFGSISGKRSDAMAALIAPHFHDIIISRPGTFKKSDPKALLEIFRRFNKDVILQEDPTRALETAKKLAGGKRPILVLGSFYMAGEIRSRVVHKSTQEKVNVLR
jgi:dihydrofolate synthase/folylpolyglutamate synthase